MEGKTSGSLPSEAVVAAGEVPSDDATCCGLIQKSFMVARLLALLLHGVSCLLDIGISLGRILRDCSGGVTMSMHGSHHSFLYEVFFWFGLDGLGVSPLPKGGMVTQTRVSLWMDIP